MSASLVGSEMCIRDRQVAEGAQSWPGTPSGAERLREQDMRGWHGQPGTCLLYTSDAADDM
eukprot:8966415-Alexandrium_andersonii.AAC.1